MKLRLTFFAVLACSTFFAQQNTLPSNGNVGIGTLTPSARLDVNGRVNIDSAMWVKDSVTIDKNLKVNQDVRFLGLTKLNETRVLDKFVAQDLAKFNSDVKFTALNTANNIDSLELLFVNSNGLVKKGDILKIGEALNNAPCKVTPNGSTFPKWKSGIDKLVVQCPGNVGIGTEDPTQRLHVVGNGRFSQRLGVGDDLIPESQVGITSNSQLIGINLIQNFDDPKSYGIRASVKNINTKAISVYHQNSDKEIFNLFASGKLEISNATMKILQLESDGLLRARKIKVDVDQWPDYVFEDNYKLMSLDELRAFIIKHKHLPNIPNQCVVEENGVDLAKMNALLLEKIEELTLYLLDQEARLKELENTISQD